MRALALLLLLSLAACEDQRPPAPTAEEDARLNEADAMMNEAANGEVRKRAETLCPQWVESGH